MSSIKLERPSASSLAARHSQPLPSPPASWDTILLIDFAQCGNSAQYRGVGWSTQEPDFVWAIGLGSTLWLPGSPANAAPLVVDTYMKPCAVRPVLRGQIIRIYANSRYLGHQIVTSPTRLRFRLDVSLFAPDEPIELEFRHPWFARVGTMGETPDNRLLSVSFLSVRIYSESLLARIGLFVNIPTTMAMLDLITPDAPVASVPSAQPRPDTRLPIKHSLAEHADRSPLLRDGWKIEPEQNLTWTAARVSSIQLPLPDDASGYRLNVSVAPLLVRNAVPRQRIAMFCDGVSIGQFSVSTNTVLSVPLPSELVAGRKSVPIDFLMPNAVSMSDFGQHTRAQYPGDQRLGFIVDQFTVDPVPAHLDDIVEMRGDELEDMPAQAVSNCFLHESIEDLPAAIEAGTGRKLTDILRVFESIGDNCGFGLAQRKGGVEVLGLLRFANTPLKNLLLGMEEEFSAVMRPRSLEVYLHDEGSPREYMLRIQRYGIRWHTMVHEHDSDLDSVFEQQSVKLGYLHRKFYEGLRASRKVYVLARSEPVKTNVVMPGWKERPRIETNPEPLKLAEALPVLTAINRYGRNTLLYVVPCKPGRKSGTVELLAPGLMRAHISSFVISNDTTLRDHAEWLRVVGNAWLLDQGPNAQFRKAPAQTKAIS